MAESARPRSPLARLLGSSPLSHEARPWYVGVFGEQEVGTIVLVDSAGLTVRQTHPQIAVLTATRLVRRLTKMPPHLTPEQVRKVSDAVVGAIVP